MGNLRRVLFSKIFKHFREYFFEIVSLHNYSLITSSFTVMAIMALLKYFKRIAPSKEEKIESVLPEPDYPLAHSIECQAHATIEAANSAVREVLTKNSINEVHISLYTRCPRISESISNL